MVESPVPGNFYTLQVHPLCIEQGRVHGIYSYMNGKRVMYRKMRRDAGGTDRKFIVTSPQFRVPFYVSAIELQESTDGTPAR